MGEALPIGLRERAVRAYESGEGSYLVVAARFGIGYRTLQDWVLMQRKTGTLEARPKGGGNPSPVDPDVLQAILRDRPDAIVDEIRTMYNARVAKAARVHRSSILRALHRLGYVFKKNVRGPRSKTDPTSKRVARRS